MFLKAPKYKFFMFLEASKYKFFMFLAFMALQLFYERRIQKWGKCVTRQNKIMEKILSKPTFFCDFRKIRRFC